MTAKKCGSIVDQSIRIILIKLQRIQVTGMPTFTRRKKNNFVHDRVEEIEMTLETSLVDMDGEIGKQVCSWK